MFLLWFLLCTSPAQSACSGIHELCLLSLHVPRSALFLHSLTLHWGHSTAFPQDFKELCCVNACSYLYNYREVIDCRGRFSNSDMTHLEDPDVVGTSSCVLFPTFLSAVLMMCEAHGRHCCSRSLLVFYSISPPDISSEDAILICL